MNSYKESDVATHQAKRDGLTCLEDCDDFARLSRKNLLMWKPWYMVAILPFGLALAFGVYVLPHFVPETKFWHHFADALVYASLAWAFAVVVYLLTIFVRVELFRCPNCSGRFGGSERCRTCGLPMGGTSPRHSVN